MMKTMPVIEFNQGIPEDVDEPDHLDVSQFTSQKFVCDLYCENIFHQGKEMRNISLNAHYIILFKSPRDFYTCKTCQSR